MEEWLETHALMMSEITACGTTASVITHHIIVCPAAPRGPNRSTAQNLSHPAAHPLHLMRSPHISRLLLPSPTFSRPLHL